MFFDFSVSYSPTHIMNLEHNQNPVLSLFNRSVGDASKDEIKHLTNSVGQ